MLWAKEQTLILLSVVFTFELAFESFKDFGGVSHGKKLKHMIKNYKTKLTTKVNSNNNNQFNIVTKDHKLYVGTLVVKELLDPTWYINIGAAEHMYFEKESFTNYKIYNNHQLVYLSDNFTHRIQGQGDIEL